MYVVKYLHVHFDFVMHMYDSLYVRCFLLLFLIICLPLR